MTQVVVRFRDVLAGPPTSWVPPGVSPSLNPSSSKNKPPTSLWRGEGRVRLGCVRACLLGVVSIEPTSLERGEGLISGWLGVVEGESEVAKAKVVVVEWVEDERYQP